MNARQKYVAAAMKRSIVFATTDPLPTPLQQGVGELAPQVQTLRDALSLVESESTAQGSGKSQQQTQERHALRDELRNGHLQPLQTIAVVLERNSPGLPKLVNLPKVSSSERALLTSAKAAIRDVEPYQTMFIDKGLPVDFLAQLVAATDALERKIDEQGESRGKQVAGRIGIANAIHVGVDAMICLGAVIKRLCAKDPRLGPAVWRAWRNASHVQRPARDESATEGFVGNTGTVVTPNTTSDTTSDTASDTAPLVSETPASGDTVTAVPVRARETA